MVFATDFTFFVCDVELAVWMSSDWNGATTTSSEEWLMLQLVIENQTEAGTHLSRIHVERNACSAMLPLITLTGFALITSLIGRDCSRCGFLCWLAIKLSSSSAKHRHSPIIAYRLFPLDTWYSELMSCSQWTAFNITSISSIWAMISLRVLFCTFPCVTIRRLRTLYSVSFLLGLLLLMAVGSCLYYFRYFVPNINRINLQPHQVISLSLFSFLSLRFPRRTAGEIVLSYIVL